MKKIQITARTRTPEPITQSVLDKAVERGKARQSTDKVFWLADWLEDQYDPTYNQAQAAVELRRLVTENLLLRQRHRDDNVEHTRILTQRDQLLRALKAMLRHMGMDEDKWNKPTFDQARAAIKQAEGENT